VEWPDRLGALRPERYLELVFSTPDIETDTRLLEINAVGPDWGWLANVIE